MDNVSGTRRLGGFGEDQCIYPLRLDGVPLEASDYPLRDFGPIGSKPKSGKSRGMVELTEAYDLMNNWVSDYCKEDGSLLHEQLRGSGAVPCLPKIPNLPQLEVGIGSVDKHPFYIPEQSRPSFNQPSVFNADGNVHTHRVPFDRGSASLRDHKSTSFRHPGALSNAETKYGNDRRMPFSRDSASLHEDNYQFFQQPGASSFAGPLYDNACVVPFDVGSANQSEETDSMCSTTSSSGYGTASSSPNISPMAGLPYWSTAYRDAEEFSQRFGYCGRLRNYLMHRPRKGKYFKKFKE